jgi:uncharacterized protein YkwD
MKVIQFKLPLLLFLPIFFTSCSPEDDGVYRKELSETKPEYSDLELEILDLIYTYRESKALRTLLKLDIVSSIALTQTNFMVEIGKVNHDNFQQRHDNLILIAAAKSVGENVAHGYSSAKDVVNTWTKSDVHKEVIENESNTHYGIATENTVEEEIYLLKYL